MRQYVEWFLSGGFLTFGGGMAYVRLKTWLITSDFDVHTGDANIATWNSLGCGEPPSVTPTYCISTENSFGSEVGSPSWAAEAYAQENISASFFTLKLNTKNPSGDSQPNQVQPSAFMIRSPHRSVNTYGVMLAVDYWQEDVIGAALNSGSHNAIVDLNTDDKIQSHVDLVH
jgi:hypothetical protein